jgi:hypothetical protein
MAGRGGTQLLIPAPSTQREPNTLFGKRLRPLNQPRVFQSAEDELQARKARRAEDGPVRLGCNNLDRSGFNVLAKPPDQVIGLNSWGWKSLRL